MTDTDEAVEVSRKWLVEVDSTTSWVAHRVNRKVLGEDNERSLLAISAEARRLAAADGGERERLRAVADAAANYVSIRTRPTVTLAQLRQLVHEWQALAALHADKEGSD